MKSLYLTGANLIKMIFQEKGKKKKMWLLRWSKKEWRKKRIVFKMIENNDIRSIDI